jgi:hypothetical protein
MASPAGVMSVVSPTRIDEGFLFTEGVSHMKKRRMVSAAVVSPAVRSLGGGRAADNENGVPSCSGKDSSASVNGRKTHAFTDRKGAFRTGGITMLVCGDSAVQSQEMAMLQSTE